MTNPQSASWRTNNPKRLSLAILLGTFLPLGVWSSFVVLSDNSVQAPDEFANYVHSVSLARGHADVLRPNVRPPLASAAAIPWYYLVGISQQAAEWSTLPFLVWLMLATYAIGRRLWGERCGCLAGIFVGLFPLSVGMSRVYLADLPAAACLTQGLLLCLAARQEGSPRGARYLLGAAVFLALASLLRMGATVGWIIPAAWLSWKYWREARGREDTWRRTFHLFQAAALGAFLLGLHYLPSFGTIGSHYMGPGRMVHLARLLSMFPVQSALVFLKSLFGLSMGPLPFLVFVAAIAMLLVRRNFREGSMPLLWFVSTLLLLSALAAWRTPRFVLPTLPAAALLMAAACETFRRPATRWTGSIGIVTVLVAQILWLDLFAPPRESLGDSAADAFEASALRDSYGLFGFPSRPWKQDDLDGFCRELLSIEKEPVGNPSSAVLVLCALSTDSPMRLDLGRTATERDWPLRFVSLSELQDVNRFPEFRAGLRQVVAISPVTEDISGDTSHVAYAGQISWDIWNELRKSFRPARLLSLGDEIRLVLWQTDLSPGQIFTTFEEVHGE